LVYYHKANSGVAQWGVARLACNRLMPVSRELEPIKGSQFLLEQETLPSLLSTGWFKLK